MGTSEKGREKNEGGPPLFFLSLPLFSLPTTESLEQARTRRDWKRLLLSVREAADLVGTGQTVHSTLSRGRKGYAWRRERVKYSRRTSFEKLNYPFLYFLLSPSSRTLLCFMLDLGRLFTSIAPSLKKQVITNY